MTPDIQHIDISDVGQLDQLLKEKKLYHMPKDMRLHLNLNWKDISSKDEYEKKLSAHISECGCAHGSFAARLFTLLAVVAIGLFLTLGTALPLFVKIISIVILPVLFVIGAYIPPLISLASLGVILFYYHAQIGVQWYWFLIMLVSAYGVGALLGKTIGSLGARKHFKMLLTTLRNEELLLENT